MKTKSNGQWLTVIWMKKPGMLVTSSSEVPCVGDSGAAEELVKEKENTASDWDPASASNR